MNSATDGFVYISLGTNVHSNTVGDRIQNVILESCAELPYKFLWKFDMQIDNVPNNVKIVKWVPQQDVLSEYIDKRYCKVAGTLRWVDCTLVLPHSIYFSRSVLHDHRNWTIFSTIPNLHFYVIQTLDNCKSSRWDASDVDVSRICHPLSKIWRSDTVKDATCPHPAILLAECILLTVDTRTFGRRQQAGITINKISNFSNPPTIKCLVELL